MAEWLWDAARATYLKADREDRLPPARIGELRREFVAALKPEVAGLAKQLAEGTIEVAAWEGAMARITQAGFLAQSLLGRGGLNAATPADAERWNAQWAAQREYLAAWGQELAAPGGLETVTADGIAARGNLYLAAGNATFEAARAAAMGVPDLPQYPADGSQECLSNCQCSWDIQETEDGWECTWRLEDAAKHCETCQANAEQWSPLFIPREGGAEPSEPDTAPVLALNGEGA